MPEDKFISEAERAEEESRAERAANLFDVRRFIGGLFVLYGLILFVLGVGASNADVDKAAGVNINLWTGLAMLVVGAIFLAWAFTRPVGRELAESGPESGGDSTSRGSQAAGGGARGD